MRKRHHINETDGTTGDTIREYLWLGLTPIAVIAANDNGVCDDQARIDELTTLITDKTTRITANSTPNGELANLVTAHEARITELDARIVVLQDRITAHQAELDKLQAQCDAAGGTSGSGEATLSYLHTDHLGKPQFATDGTGTVIWDAGGQVTPFGDGINLAAAFTQNLQFPGQYADKETGLSHNHHRTYDPALGRYLQSDPIGLAGGLNRYAYVGGNPLGWVDPSGLKWVK